MTPSSFTLPENSRQSETHSKIQKSINVLEPVMKKKAPPKKPTCFQLQLVRIKAEEAAQGAEEREPDTLLSLLRSLCVQENGIELFK